MAPQDDFGPWWQMTRTDAQGRYQINPFPPREGMSQHSKSYYLNVFPPDNKPMLVHRIAVPISRAKRQHVDVSLDQGHVILGRVTDDDDQPVEGARVQYRPQSPGHERAYMTAPTEASQLQVAITREDGSYELAVPTGDGELLVLGPTLDFIPTETRRGHYRLYADATAHLSIAPEVTTQTQNFRLRRGITLTGRATDESGAPIESFELISARCLDSGYQPEHSRQCSNGYFELHGCDPNLTYQVSLLDQDHRRGAAVELSAKHAVVPAEVQLQAFGSAAIKFETREGQPANARAMLSLVLQDGAPHRFYLNVKEGTTPLEGLFRHYGGDRSTDEQGHLRFDELIPGAEYMVRWQPDVDGMRSPEPWPHVHFRVKPGENVDLGTKVAAKSGF